MRDTAAISARVLLLRDRQHAFGRSRLEDAARPQDHDVLGEVLDHDEAVRDEQVGDAEFSRSSRSRLRIFTRTDTSRADVGSSQTMRRGSTASARAMAMHRRCPPDNSCVERCSESGRSGKVDSKRRSQSNALDQE
jgi:hypothetical protein